MTPEGQAYELGNSNVSADGGIQYKITPSDVAYFHFSQGYRPGGFNSDSLPNIADTYKAEKMNNFEIGLKSEILDRRLSVNTAIFRQEYRNMQEDVLHFLDNQILQSTANAAKARMQGVEVEAVAMPTRNLRLQLAYSYLDAKYLNYLNGGVDESTLHIPFTPKSTATVSADYTFHLPLTLFTVLTTGVDAQYRSAYTTAPTDNPVTDQAAWTKIDGHIELSDEEHKYSIKLWADNLTNRHTIANGEIVGNLSHYQTENLPRMYGIRFGAKF